MDADEDGWEHLGADLEERRRQIRESGRSFPTDDFFSYSLCSFNMQMVASHDLLHG